MAQYAALSTISVYHSSIAHFGDKPALSALLAQATLYTEVDRLPIATRLTGVAFLRGGFVSAAAAISSKLAWENRVLLVSGSEFRRSLRAAVLRGHGFQVEVATDLAQVRSLWRPNTYAWLLVDVLRQLPGEILDFCEQIKHADPRQQIAFLIGPPRFVSLHWPEEAVSEAEPGEELRESAPKLPRAA